MLKEFHTSSDDVQHTVTDMINDIDVQNEKIDITYRDFDGMQQSLLDLDSSVNCVHEEMEELKVSNQSIVEAISDMSSVSEQISENTKQVENLSGETRRDKQERKQVSRLQSLLHVWRNL